MDLSALKGILRAAPAFANLDEWRVAPIHLGLTGRCTYRFRLGSDDYFVKQLKDNEREAWRLLAPLDLQHVPRVVCLDLLASSILVNHYVPGGTLRSKRIEPGLLQDLARIQNHLNLERPASEGAYDGWFHARYFLESFAGAFSCLSDLRGAGVAAADECTRLVDFVFGLKATVADGLANMPPAWLHNDFREENVLRRRPQQIVDWGSSYGYGPFLFDPAPFLFARADSLAAFSGHSDICRRAGEDAVRRWLHVATCARLVEWARYLDVLTSPAKAERYLAYHYRTYRRLIDLA